MLFFSPLLLLLLSSSSSSYSLLCFLSFVFVVFLCFVILLPQTHICFMLRFCIKSGTLGTHVYGFRTLTHSHILTHILKRRKSTLTHIFSSSLVLYPSRSLWLIFSIEIAVVNKFEQHTHMHIARLAICFGVSIGNVFEIYYRYFVAVSSCALCKLKSNNKFQDNENFTEIVATNDARMHSIAHEHASVFREMHLFIEWFIFSSRLFVKSFSSEGKFLI